ncbi:MAG: SDR family oxidoreductase [Parvularculaceae bacterium]|nr:SDR family oxidoreductase [Parvularculaceae bacterium]
MNAGQRFAGKSAIVTGGGSGIGRACALMLARGGARVGVFDVNDEAAKGVASEISQSGGSASPAQVDVADHRSIAAAVHDFSGQFGRLDIAVNNAGIGGDNSLMEEATVEFWDRTIAINLSGVYHAMRAEFAFMRVAGGAIVNMASILGEVGFPGAAPYVAAKHGVIGLTKSAALSWGQYGIRVTAVCPTFVRTPLTENLPAEGWSEIIAKHPLGRLPTPEEVAAMVCYLASDEARAVTGSAHLIDAGYAAS